MTKNAIIAASIVVVAAAAIWMWLGGSDQPQVVAGVGAFDAEIFACKDKVFEDLQHPLELVFVENTEWHAGDATELTVGGTLRTPNVEGRLDTMAYQCLSRAGQIVSMEIR